MTFSFKRLFWLTKKEMIRIPNRFLPISKERSPPLGTLRHLYPPILDIGNVDTPKTPFAKLQKCLQLEG